VRLFPLFWTFLSLSVTTSLARLRPPSLIHFGALGLVIAMVVWPMQLVSTLGTTGIEQELLGGTALSWTKVDQFWKGRELEGIGWFQLFLSGWFSKDLASRFFWIAQLQTLTWLIFCWADMVGNYLGLGGRMVTTPSSLMALPL